MFCFLICAFILPAAPLSITELRVPESVPAWWRKSDAGRRNESAAVRFLNEGPTALGNWLIYFPAETSRALSHVGAAAAVRTESKVKQC